ncbi:FAD-binding oxidoreductase [Lipingzhangella sp. LS1_29]|uniref:FAD-binding oxidoreductase n=1 Tax=Lipingzhangella rawalii TaxID=2055835 RepID=A0ABU2HA60_9ACTN|nr:FAD-binding oxidoreductase [Lipingzhangella rawalii]MDS1272200.1 FAD-binding oxidoreductase [Lipingzhangella rawalii]
MSSERILTGWGRTAPTSASVTRPRSPTEVATALHRAPGRGTVARGLGRAYGDAAQCAGGQVLDTADITPGLRIDADAGTVTAAAGTSLAELVRSLVPRGFFLPVTPGTRHVTLGGAIAADIHGKNHHRDSSIGAHLRDLTLVTPDGSTRRLRPDSPHEGRELFWATVGGMGLTGVITEATLHLIPVASSRMRVDTDRTPDLDTTLERMCASDASHSYTVAWLDLLARGSATGRGVLTRAEHAHPEELCPRDRLQPLAYAPASARLSTPPGLPGGLLNPATLRAFNTAYYHRAPLRRRGQIQALDSYFYPLDVVAGWNRLYGPRGLVQYQFVVPFGDAGTATLRRVVTHLTQRRAPAFLTVLKRFGAATPAPLSFPSPGWTLAVDLPADTPGLGALLSRLDAWVLSAGGRIYLAKDSRASAATVHAMYPRLAEWRRVRDRVDPHGVLTSDLNRRLLLTAGAV